MCNLKINLIENRANTSYSGNGNLRAISCSDSTTYTSGNNIKTYLTIVPNIKEFALKCTSGFSNAQNKYYVLKGLFLSGLFF